MDVNSIKPDQSGPIKSWFQNTFKKLGKRTRHNDGGHLKAPKRKPSPISLSAAAKMYEDRPTNVPLSPEMESWKEKGLSVDDAKAISNPSNQAGNTPLYKQVYNKKQGIKPTPTNNKPLVNPIAKEDDNK